MLLDGKNIQSLYALADADNDRRLRELGGEA